MPDLPTISVTTVQADRILSVFGDVAAYRTWLKQTLREHVISVESQAIQEQCAVDLQAKRSSVESDLNM